MSQIVAKYENENRDLLTKVIATTCSDQSIVFDVTVGDSFISSVACSYGEANNIASEVADLLKKYNFVRG